MSSTQKITKARLSNLSKREAYAPTGSTTRNVLQATVKDLYKRGVIKTIRNATALMDLLHGNMINEFDKRLGKIDAAE